MKKLIAVLAIAYASFALVGCAGYDATGKKGMIGSGTGAAGGALLGQAIGKNTESALIGAAVGGLLGYVVGNEMDKFDQQQMNSALEHGRSNVPVEWTNPDSNAAYTVTPEPAYQTQSGQMCRNATIAAVIDGQQQTVESVACREGRGVWKLRQ